MPFYDINITYYYDIHTTNIIYYYKIKQNKKITRIIFIFFNQYE